MNSIINIFLVCWKLFRIPIAFLSIVGVLVAVSSFSSLYLIFNNQVPVEIPEQNFEFIESSPSYMYDVNGDVIATFRSFDLYIPVAYEELPDSVVGAVVSNEDQSFFEHNGADITGILRAAVANVQTGGNGQGGSTITQQVARGFYLSPEKTYERKVREILLAIQLEQVLTKEEILESYLNLAYFGEGAYGIGAAAEIYFRKDVSDLSASEAASLVASIPAPSLRNPRINPDFNESMRVIILGKMLFNDFIDWEEYNDEINKNINVLETETEVRPSSKTNVIPAPRTSYGDYPFFVDAAIKEVKENLGNDILDSNSLHIYTTLDPEQQTLAIEKAEEQITGSGSEGVASSIVTVENETGYVLAAVGGTDWETSQVNLALGGSLGFQPGSTLKPFLYLLSLESGLNPTDVIPAPLSWRVPECLADQCSISGGARGSTVVSVDEEGNETSEIVGSGESTLNNALKFSYNTPWAIKAHEFGTSNFAEFLKDIGVDVREADYYSPTIALGAYEVSPLGLASGYTTLAREGSYLEPTFVLYVETENEKLLDNRDREGEQIFDADLGRWTAEAMILVTESGTGTRAALQGGPVAGKTGTTSDNKAAWFAGFTPEYTSVVWVGNPETPQPLSNIGGFGNISGGNLPASIWRSYMSEFMEGKTWQFRTLPALPDVNLIEEIVVEIEEEPLEPIVITTNQKPITSLIDDCLFECVIVETNNLTN